MDFRIVIPMLAATLILVGCTTNSRSPAGSSSGRAVTASPTPATIVTGGARAARIIFKQSANPEGGSFDAPALSGIQYAQRVFDASGALLSSWPQWLSSVELGITGTSAETDKKSYCARFATSTEYASPCNLGAGQINCGAPDSYYRISEHDCAKLTGESVGDDSSGVFIRATFNRDAAVLGTGENIMAVLEYAASAANAAPADPASCFENGALKPANCNELVWQSYLKATPSETVSPFLLLFPPVQHNPGSNGPGFATRQIFLPLAGNPTLKIFQLNRIKSVIQNQAAFDAACAPSGANSAASSPYCTGAVFIALTFHRI
ncbi:MAG: hypothetical protein NDJ89_14215 [Oligoflexia bacterium]|nr:hypothetical protein [Oligoflexia bacterium]